METGKRNISMRNLLKITSGLGVTLEEFFDSDLFAQLYDEEGGGAGAVSKRPNEGHSSGL